MAVPQMNFFGKVRGGFRLSAHANGSRELNTGHLVVTAKSAASFGSLLYFASWLIQRMFNRIWLTLGASMVLATSALFAQIEVPKTMTFDGIKFTKAFSDTASSGPLTEYLPKGQSLESWTKLMGIYEFPKLKDPTSAAVKLATTLKEINPQAQSQVLENPDAGIAMVDFVTWPKDSAFVEFNIWKYRKSSAGGLLAIQYAERAYTDQEGFLKKLATRRATLIAAMAEFDF